MARPRKVPKENEHEKDDADKRIADVEAENLRTEMPPSAGDEDEGDEDEDEDEEDEGDEDEDEDEEDEDGDREDDKFDQLVAKLSGSPAAKPGAAPGTDLGSMLVVMMMQERAQSRREAREMRREQAKAKAQMDRLVLGVLLKGNKPDPFMLEMFKSLAGGEQQKATFKAMMDINSENAKAQLANMKELFSSTDELKNRVFEQVLSRMEGNGKDASSGSVALDVIRELKDVAAPILAGMARPNRNQVQAQVAPAAGQVPGKVPNLAAPNPGGGAPTGVEGQPDPVSIIMRTVHHVHSHPEMTPPERRRIRSQLATIIMDVPALADAIVQDDEKAAAECVQQYVLSDPAILAWVQQPGVPDWLNNYLKTEIADVLDAMMEVEEPAEDAGDEGEDEDQPQGRKVVTATAAAANSNGKT